MAASNPDPFDLDRFVAAQRGLYDQALDELRQGLKQSHWMWFIFPQAAGLGRSAMARRYAIGSPDEGRAYLAHPLLGARLEECSRAVLAHAGKSAEAILGPIDAMKLRSSMTLFGTLAGPDSPYAACLRAFFDGRPDPATIGFLASSQP
jgi:uncharacterized protein (DUF1810 family)